MPKFEREVEIDAPIDKVWAILIDPQYWPEWLPGVDSLPAARVTGLGSSVQFMENDQAGSATFVKIQEPYLLELVTQVGDDKDQHVFKLKPTGGLFGMAADETKVEYTLDTLTGGGIFGKFIMGGNPVDTMKVNKAMVRFRKLVEKMFDNKE